jgi:hypothetical protein
MTQTKIISGFPGTGKSYCKQNMMIDCIDSDSSEFSWMVDDFGFRVRHPNFPKNYIEHIKRNIGNVEYIFVSTHKEVRDALNAECLLYFLVYPEMECIDEYLDRYSKRGSSAEFLFTVKNNWELWLADLQSEPYCIHYELSADEYMSDVINSF